jgi:hypothetical protein
LENHDRPPAARPLFRKLAFAVAVVCLIAALLVAIYSPRDEVLLSTGIFLFVGAVMLAIGITGNWPPRQK